MLQAFCRVNTANILQPTGRTLQTFWRENTANILKRECCKHFKIRYIFLRGWGCRLDALNILQGEHCIYFTAWILQACNNNILALTMQQYCHIKKAGKALQLWCSNNIINPNFNITNYINIFLKIFTSKESISIAFVKETRERPPRFP